MSDHKKVVSLNTFAFDLFRVLSSNSGKNEFFSPFSVLTALNMTLLGARNNTEKELFEGLRYSVGFEKSEEVHTFMKKTLETLNVNQMLYTLDIANRVLVHKELEVKQEYLKQLQENYKASLDAVDFEKKSEEIMDMCNKWVDTITKGKIPNILESIDPGTVAILLNAIYFKGVWEEPFDEEITQAQPFYNFGDKNKSKDVPLMYKSDVEIPLLSATVDGEELLMIELPYKGNISMNFLMTKSIDGLQKIFPKLNYELISNMTQIATKIDDLLIPKFKIETDYELVDPLMQLGIKDAFKNNADFGGIREAKGIKISKIIHKAAVEVNEEGTVAAAATAVQIMLCCAVINPIQFRVDHPFVYFIRDTKTGVILFVGKVDEL